MNMQDATGRQRFAEMLAVKAGQLALEMRSNLAPAEAKSAIDFCTEADRAVEMLVRDQIASTYGEPVLGEEYGHDAGTDGNAGLWVVDPIDGTTEYIHAAHAGASRWPSSATERSRSGSYTHRSETGCSRRRRARALH